MAEPEARQNRASLVVSMLMIGVGLLVLMGQVFHVGAIWPLFIIVPGMLFFVGMAFGGKAAGPLAIPGSIVTMVGLVLMVQSWLNYFQSWAYAWALIIVAVGIGFLIHSAWTGERRLSRSGWVLVRVGTILFVVLGALFELVFHLSHTSIGGFIFPIVMIGFGVYLLARRGRRAAERGEVPARSADVTPPPPPRPPKPAAPPVAETQFEPLDMTRGARGTRSRSKTGSQDK